MAPVVDKVKYFGCILDEHVDLKVEEGTKPDGLGGKDVVGLKTRLVGHTFMKMIEARINSVDQVCCMDLKPRALAATWIR